MQPLNPSTPEGNEILELLETERLLLEQRYFERFNQQTRSLKQSFEACRQELAVSRSAIEQRHQELVYSYAEIETLRKFQDNAHHRLKTHLILLLSELVRRLKMKSKQRKLH